MNLHDDERGLIGKILVLWLVVLALVVVTAIDGGSILLARVRTAQLARDAATAGARTYEETGNRRKAVAAAVASVTGADEDARLKDFSVSKRGDVTVVVTDQAGTLLVGRVGFLRDLAAVTASDTSSG